MANSNLITTEQRWSYLTALDAAIFRGVDYVSYDGNQIKYRSLADMYQLRARQEQHSRTFDMPVTMRSTVPSQSSLIPAHTINGNDYTDFIYEIGAGQAARTAANERREYLGKGVKQAAGNSAPAIFDTTMTATRPNIGSTRYDAYVTCLR